MKHLSEEDLILHYYGEPVAAAIHITECDDCRRRFDELSEFLGGVQLPAPPAKPEDYGTAVWNRIRPHLPVTQPARPVWWLVPQRWAAVGAVAALVTAAFLVGHFAWRPRPAAPPVAATTTQVKERVLLVALGDHLDRSQMLLLELTHAPAANQLELSTEREQASDLLASNRLYRQTAQHMGDTNTAAFLDELERLLIEVAHQPSPVTEAQVLQIQHRIEAQGLLFKVRVIRSNTLSDLRSTTPTTNTKRPTI